MGNKAEFEKLVIETRTDLNGNDQGTKIELKKQIYGASIPLKETTATTKERPNFLVEVQAKVYYGLKMMARKFRKYGLVKSIEVHQQNVPTYYVNCKKEEDRVNALIELLHEEGMARVVATEERNVNVTEKRKTPRWFLCTFKDRKRNYMKSNIYLKQQLKKDSFEVKRYGKELLVQIKE